MAYLFEKRFESYCSSLAALEEAPLRDRTDSFVLSGTAAKYCITFELAWKVMKGIAREYYGVTDYVTGSPKETLRKAFSLSLICDERWMEMLKLRNDLAHDYDLTIITEAFDRITEEYLALFRDFQSEVCALLKRENNSLLKKDE